MYYRKARTRWGICQRTDRLDFRYNISHHKARHFNICCKAPVLFQITKAELCHAALPNKRNNAKRRAITRITIGQEDNLWLNILQQAVIKLATKIIG